LRSEVLDVLTRPADDVEAVRARGAASCAEHAADVGAPPVGWELVVRFGALALPLRVVVAGASGERELGRAHVRCPDPAHGSRLDVAELSQHVVLPGEEPL